MAEKENLEEKIRDLSVQLVAERERSESLVKEGQVCASSEDRAGYGTLVEGVQTHRKTVKTIAKRVSQSSAEKCSNFQIMSSNLPGKK